MRGYLTRRLVDVAQDVIVTIEDCGSEEGLWMRNSRDILSTLEERIIGRDKRTGAPLGRRRLYDAPYLEQLPPDSHIRLAAPRSNRGAFILRRGYATGDGLLFLAFMRDPRRQYVPLQRKLAEHGATVIVNYFHSRDAAQRTRDELRAGVGLQLDAARARELGGRARGDELAAEKDRDAVADELDLGE